MKRISVHIPEEQQEWIDHVALKIDGSRSDVVQRAITAYRRERGDIDDSAPATTESAGPDEPATNGQSRAELLERVEKLEETLQAESASADSAGEEDKGETEADAGADGNTEHDDDAHGNDDHNDDELGDESLGWR